MGSVLVKKPNILVFVLDQLSFRALDLYGGYCSMPFITSLARDGITVSDCYCSYPLCQPSRASLWSGQYPHRNKVWSNGRQCPITPLDETYPSLGQCFSDAGYECRHFGKKHDGGALRGFICSAEDEERIPDDNPLFPYNMDTYADVYVNDRLVRTCDNMFRTWTVDVKPYLHEGENEIRICFSSVFKVDMPKYLAAPFKLRVWPNNDQNSDIWLSPYARKAGYNYGWDWGPRLITTGIWRSVSIRAWSGLDVAAAHIKTLSIPEKVSGKAYMQADCMINSDFEGSADLTVAWEDRSVTRKVILQQGENKVSLDFSVSRPRLWWCNGAGSQDLYRQLREPLKVHFPHG